MRGHFRSTQRPRAGFLRDSTTACALLSLDMPAPNVRGRDFMGTVRFISAAALFAFVCVAPASARAQEIDAPSQQVSASPFLIMFKYFNVEYERRLTKASTWGVSTSFVPGRNADYRNVGGFWHFYPGGRALQGFYIGGRVQMHHGSALTESANFRGVGFELGKKWIVGRR